MPAYSCLKHCPWGTTRCRRLSFKVSEAIAASSQQSPGESDRNRSRKAKKSLTFTPKMFLVNKNSSVCPYCFYPDVSNSFMSWWVKLLSAFNSDNYREVVFSEAKQRNEALIMDGAEMRHPRKWTVTSVHYSSPQHLLWLEGFLFIYFIFAEYL